MTITEIEKKKPVDRKFRRKDIKKQPLNKALEEWIEDYKKRVGSVDGWIGHHCAFHQLCILYTKLWSVDETLGDTYTIVKDHKLHSGGKIKKRELTEKGKETFQSLVDAFKKWIPLWDKEWPRKEWSIFATLDWLAEGNELKDDYLPVCEIWFDKNEHNPNADKDYFTLLHDNQKRFWEHRWDLDTMAWSVKKGKNAEWEPGGYTFNHLEPKNFIRVWQSSESKTDLIRTFGFKDCSDVRQYWLMANSILRKQGYELPDLPDYNTEEQKKIDQKEFEKQLKGLSGFDLTNLGLKKLKPS